MCEIEPDPLDLETFSSFCGLFSSLLAFHESKHHVKVSMSNSPDTQAMDSFIIHSNSKKSSISLTLSAAGVSFGCPMPCLVPTLRPDIIGDNGRLINMNALNPVSLSVYTIC